MEGYAPRAEQLTDDMSTKLRVHSAAPLDWTMLSRTLLPRRVHFHKAKRPDYVSRPSHVINLNPKGTHATRGERDGDDISRKRPRDNDHPERDMQVRWTGECPPCPFVPTAFQPALAALTVEGGAAQSKGLNSHDPASPVPLDSDDPYVLRPEVVLQPVDATPPGQWTSIFPVGRGLINPDVTCFANAVLQCLTYVPPFHAYLTRVNGSRRLPSYPPRHPAAGMPADFDPLTALSEVCVTLTRPLSANSLKKGAFFPRDVVGNLRRISKSLRRGVQQDANEFAVSLLDACQEQLLREMAPGRKLSLVAQATTPIMRIFGGWTRTSVSWRRDQEHLALKRQRSSLLDQLPAPAAAGGFQSNSFSPFSMLHLPVVGTALSDCLDAYFKIDEIDGYTTPRRANVVAAKRDWIHIPPVVLTLHLKRFNNSGNKVSRPIGFDSSIDVRRWCTSTCVGVFPTTYDLCGIVEHCGRHAGSGHYVAHVRAPNGLWQTCDDDVITLCRGQEALFARAQAFMLMYVRRERDAPRSTASSISRRLAIRPANREDLGVEVHRAASTAETPRCVPIHPSEPSFQPEVDETPTHEAPKAAEPPIGERPNSKPQIKAQTTLRKPQVVLQPSDATRVVGSVAADKLKSFASQVPASVARQAHHGKFKTWQRDAAWDAEFDKGRMKKMRSQHFDPDSLEQLSRLGRNKFQERSNVVHRDSHATRSSQWE